MKPTAFAAALALTCLIAATDCNAFEGADPAGVAASPYGEDWGYPGSPTPMPTSYPDDDLADSYGIGFKGHPGGGFKELPGTVTGPRTAPFYFCW